MNQSITILLAIFLTKILQAHECKCFACESNVTQHIYERVIIDVKKNKKAKLKQSIIHQLSIEFESLYADEAHKRAKMTAEERAQISVGRAELQVLREQLRNELRSEVTAEALNEATRKGFRAASDIHQAAIPEAYRFYHPVPADLLLPTAPTEATKL